MMLTKENLIKFLDDRKVVYAENTSHSVPPEGYELGDEVIESESEENELINSLIKEVKAEFTE
jgi:phage antirepressor YoqD-like protein